MSWGSDSNANRFKKSYIQGFLDVSGGNLIVESSSQIQVMSSEYSGEAALLIKPDRFSVFTGQSSYDISYVTFAALGYLGASYEYTTADVYNRIQFIASNTLQGNSTIIGSDNSLCDLTVYGNIKTVGNKTLFITGDTSLNQKLYVAGNVTMDSNLSITQDLSVNRFLFVTNRSQFNNDVSMNRNVDIGSGNNSVAINKDISTNFALDVSGITMLRAPLYTLADVSFSQKLFVQGDASFNSNLAIGQDVSINRSLFVTNRASFNNDVSMNRNVDIGSGNNSVAINKDISSNFALDVSGVTNFRGPLYTLSDVSFSQKLFVTLDASFNSSLSIGQDVSINRSLFVTNRASFINDVSMNRNLDIGSGNNSVAINKDISANFALDVSGVTNFRGPLYTLSDVSINGKLSVGGDISLNGNISIGTSVQTIGKGLKQPPAPMTANVTNIPGHGAYYVYTSSVGETIPYFMFDNCFNTVFISPSGFTTPLGDPSINVWALSDTISDVSSTAYPGYRFHIDLPYQINLTSFNYQTSTGRYPAQGTMLGSNNGTSWYNIYSFDLSGTYNNSTTQSGNIIFENNLASNTSLYSKYALVIKSIACGSFPGGRFTMREIQLYGNNNILSTQGIGATSIGVSDNLTVGATSNLYGNVTIGSIDNVYNRTGAARLLIMEPSGTVASATSGSLVLQHGDASGVSSIVFRSTNDVGSDYAYIQYQESVGSGTTQKGLLTIGVENESGSGTTADRISLYAAGGSGFVGVNTTDPIFHLDISGTANVSSTLTTNVIDPSNVASRMTIAQSQTTGNLDIGTNASRSGAINIGTANNSKTITVGGSSTGTTSLQGGTITISPASILELGNNQAGVAITIGREQTTGTLDIGNFNTRTAPINIGTGSSAKTMSIGGAATTLQMYGVDVSFAGNLKLGSGNKSVAINKDISTTFAFDVSGATMLRGVTSTLSDVSINGKLLVSSDVSLNQKLFVNNDVSFNTNLTVGQYLTVNNRALFTADVSINNNTRLGAGTNSVAINKDISSNFALDVSGITMMRAPLYTLSDVSLSQKLFVQGDASFNSSLAIGQDVSINRSLFVTNRSLFSSDVSMNRNLGIGSGNNSVAINKDISSNFALDVSGITMLRAPLYTLADVSLSQKLFVQGDASFNSNLAIGQDVSINRSLFVTNRSLFSSDVSFSRNVDIGSGNNSVAINKDISSNFALDVSGVTNLRAPLYTLADVSLSQKLFVQGDASFNSNLSVGQDLSVNRFLYVNNATLFNGDISTNQNLYVAGRATFGRPPSAAATYELDVSGQMRIYEQIGSNVISNTSVATLTLEHADASGASSIMFKSPSTTSNGDYAYIKYQDLSGTTTTNAGLLTIGVENDPTVPTTKDMISLYAAGGSGYVGVNTLNPSFNLDVSGGFRTSGDASINVFDFYRSITGNPTLRVNNVEMITLASSDVRFGNATTSGNMSLAGNQNTGSLYIGHVQTSGNLFIGSGNTGRTGNIVIGGPINKNTIGNVSITGSTIDSSNNLLQFVPDASFGKNMFVSRDISVNANLYVGQDVSINRNFYVENRTVLNNDVSINTNLDVTGNAIVSSSLITNTINPSSAASTLNIATTQTSGTINIATESTRTGAINIGNRAAETTIIRLGNFDISDNSIRGHAGLSTTVFSSYNKTANLRIGESMTGGVHQYSFNTNSGSVQIAGTTRNSGSIEIGCGNNNALHTMSIGTGESNAGKLNIANGALSTGSINILDGSGSTGTATIGRNNAIRIVNSTTTTVDVSATGLLTLRGSSLNVFGATLFNSDVSMNQNVELGAGNNSVAINKDISSNFALDISGATNFRGVVSTLSDLSINGRLFSSGDVSLNQKLFVQGDASFNRNLAVGQDVSINRNLDISGTLRTRQIEPFDPTLTGGLIIGSTLVGPSGSVKIGTTSATTYVDIGNTTINGGTFRFNQNGLITGNTTALSMSFADNIQTGNVSVGPSLTTGNLIIGSQSTVNHAGNISIGNASGRTGAIIIGGHNSSSLTYVNAGSVRVKDQGNGTFYVGRIPGDGTATDTISVALAGGVTTTGSINILDGSGSTGNVFIGRNNAIKITNSATTTVDVSATGLLTLRGSSLNVFGATLFNSDVSMNRNVKLGAANNSVAINKDISSNFALDVSGATNFRGVVNTLSDLSINGRLFASGDVSLNQKLFVSNDISTNSNVYVGNTVFTNTMDTMVNTANIDIGATQSSGRINIGGLPGRTGNINIGTNTNTSPSFTIQLGHPSGVGPNIGIGLWSYNGSNGTLQYGGNGKLGATGNLYLFSGDTSVLGLGSTMTGGTVNLGRTDTTGSTTEVNIATGSASTGNVNLGRGSAIKIANGTTTNIDISASGTLALRGTTVTAPTPPLDNSSNQVATTAFVKDNINNLVAGAGPALDTLYELSNAINDDANFGSNIVAMIGLRAYDTSVVHLTGIESIEGNKTFVDDMVLSKNLTINQNLTTLQKGAFGYGTAPVGTPYEFDISGQMRIYEEVGSNVTGNTSVATLTLEHGDASGCSSIMFKSPSTATNGDYAYIKYQDLSGTTSNNGLLTIGIENDTNVSTTADKISLYTANGQGFVGVNTLNPTYGLDVTGNVRITSFVLANTFVAHTTTVGANIFGNSTGNITFGGTIGAANTISIASSTSTGNVRLGGNVKLGYGVAYVGVNKDPSPGFLFDVSGDSLFRNRLYVNSDASFGRNVIVVGDVSLNNKLFVSNDVSINTNLYVGQDVSINRNLYVANRTVLSSDVSMTQNLDIGSGNNSVAINKDISSNFALDISGETNLRGNLTTLGTIAVNGGGITINGTPISTASSGTSLTTQGVKVGTDANYFVTIDKANFYNDPSLVIYYNFDTSTNNGTNIPNIAATGSLYDGSFNRTGTSSTTGMIDTSTKKYGTASLRNNPTLANPNLGVQVLNPTSIPISTTMTFSVWINKVGTPVTSFDRIFEYSTNPVNNGSESNTIALDINSSGRIIPVLTSGPSSCFGTLTSPIISYNICDGSWNHIVWTITPSTSFIYINGSIKHYDTITAAVPTTSRTAAYIAFTNYNQGQRDFSGNIDEFRYFSGKALNQAEIYQLYNNTFFNLDICGGFIANGSSVIYEPVGSKATANTGTLTLLHGDASGSSSIMFKSVNDPLEYGYIQYDENTVGSTGYHYGLMTIGIENDSSAYTDEADRVALFPSGGRGFVGVNTKTPIYSLDVSGNFRVNNSVAINKDISPQYALDISGQTNISGNVTTTLDISMNRNLLVGQDASINRFLYVANNSLFARDVSINGNTRLNNSVSINKDISSQYALDISGQMRILERTGTSASTTTGSLILEHTAVGGTSSIMFKGPNSSSLDYAYVQYTDASSVIQSLLKYDLSSGTAGAAVGNTGFASTGTSNAYLSATPTDNSFAWILGSSISAPASAPVCISFNQTNVTLANTTSRINYLQANGLSSMSSFTFSAWIRPTQIAAPDGNIINWMIANLTDASPNGSVDIYLNANGYIFALVGEDTGNYVMTQTDLTANNWYHLVFTFDANLRNGFLYLNGALGTTAGSGLSNKVLKRNSSLLIGMKWGWNTGTGSNLQYGASNYYKGFRGQMAFINVFDRGISASDVQYLYNNPAYNITTNPERGLLTIGVENDTGAINNDRIVLWPGAGTGNVGINTRTPSTTLDVNGTLNVSSNITSNNGTVIISGQSGAVLRLANQSPIYNAGETLLDFYGGESWRRIGGIGCNDRSVGPAGGWVSSTSFYTTWDTSYNLEAMRITGTSKTVANCALVEVYGDISCVDISCGRIEITETVGTAPSITSTSYGSLTLRHKNAGGTSSIVFPSVNNGSSDYAYIQYQEHFQTTDFSNINLENGLLIIGIENDGTTAGGADRISLFAAGGTGYVGINTKNPLYTLDVNGDVKAQRLVVASSSQTASQTLLTLMNPIHGGTASQINMDFIVGNNPTYLPGRIAFNQLQTGPGGSWFSSLSYFVSYNVVPICGMTITGNSTYTVDVSINGNVVATSYNATSDYRIKTRVMPLDLTFTVDVLNPVSYLLKDDKDEKLQVGFIAHEVQEFYPFLVNGVKDGPNMQSINYNGFIGILTKEIKDLKAKVKEQEERIAVQDARLTVQEERIALQDARLTVQEARLQALEKLLLNK